MDESLLAKWAGFDGVRLHFAHGWRIHDFLSLLSNHRTDEFGGNAENRCRFPLMILQAVWEAIGDDMLMELRLNGNDDVEDGILPKAAAEQVIIFQDYADLIYITCSTRIDVTSRTRQMPTSFFLGPHNAYASEIIKKRTNPKIPIDTIGSVYSAAIAEDILTKGQADYVLTVRIQTF